MDQTHLVGGMQCLRNLADNSDRPSWSQCSVVKHRTQVASVYEAHIYIEPAIDFTVMMDRDNVRIVEPSRHMRFASKPLLKLTALYPVLWQQLQRDNAVGLGVVGSPNLAHTAAAQQ